MPAPCVASIPLVVSTAVTALHSVRLIELGRHTATGVVAWAKRFKHYDYTTFRYDCGYMCPQPSKSTRSNLCAVHFVRISACPSHAPDRAFHDEDANGRALVKSGLSRTGQRPCEASEISSSFLFSPSTHVSHLQCTPLMQCPASAAQRACARSLL